MPRRTSKPVVRVITSLALEPLRIPVKKPRNPVAVDPLLKKSGTHLDQRRKRTLAADQRFADSMKELERQSRVHRDE